MMTLTLACDHRAVDGAYAAGFLNSVKDCLQNFDQISSTK
jgi:pyruvate/2-oxoglutarate dehydrogenase complex dihydrolipoamide acyltransferase (E2) component